VWLTSATGTTRIDANSYRDYRPASQALLSVVYTSVNQCYFQCDKEIYRAGRTQNSRINAYTYPDYRSALQAVVSVIYVSWHYQSV